MPIPITEPQFLAIANAAAALCPADRDQFIVAVARALEGQPIGDGTVGRAIRTVQVAFPHPEPPRSLGRWDRDEPGFQKSSKRAY
jgi:hypothetical protein